MPQFKKQEIASSVPKHVDCDYMKCLFMYMQRQADSSGCVQREEFWVIFSLGNTYFTVAMCEALF